MIALFPLCALLAMPASPAPESAAPAARVPAEPDALEYRIGPEDTLQITVWQNADLSRVVPVRPDGKISLPLINDVQAAGLTPLQLRDSVKQKLAEYAPDAEVSVIVGEVQSFKVAILGKVQRPDRYKLRGPTTVLDALALAGGFQEYADTNSIVVLRPEPFFVQGRQPGKTFRRLPFDYRRVITVGGETSNFSLQPGDIIVVP
jgi:polysaccharide export outer membrane protein